MRTLHFPGARRNNNTVPHHMRRAFTLIELLVVILILMTFMYLGATLLLPSVTATSSKVTPLKLKRFITTMKKFDGQGTLICTGKRCADCYFRGSLDAPFERIDATFDFGGERVQAYLLGERDLIKADYGTFRNERVCLMVRFYRNGSSTPLILKTDTSAFLLPSRFGIPRRFATLVEAEEAWRAPKERIVREGIF